MSQGHWFQDPTTNGDARGFPSDSDGKTNKPAFNAGDPNSIPGSGNPLEKGMATKSSMLAWRIPWTEVPGRLQYWGGKESDMTEGLQFLFFLSSPLHKMLSYLHVTYTDSPLQFKLSADYLYLA